MNCVRCRGCGLPYSERRSHHVENARELNETVGTATTFTTRLRTGWKLMNCTWSSTRVQTHRTLPAIARALSARTTKGRRRRREAGCRQVPRWVTAVALSRSCTLLKVMAGETHAEG